MQVLDEVDMVAQANKPEPLTTGQVAKYCHVTHRGVLKWVQSGKLKAYRTPGNHSRVDFDDFIRFLKLYQMPIPNEIALPNAQKKILIVDDDRGIVHSLQRLLTLENKYQMDVAYDGFSAGQKFTAFKPDFIILDIHMPGVDGCQVCADIRKDPENKHVIILVISGISEPLEIQKVFEVGANDFLAKPFSNLALMEKLKKMLG